MFRVRQATLPSRSQALSWVCCEQVRPGIEDDTVDRVVTDAGSGACDRAITARSVYSPASFFLGVFGRWLRMAPKANRLRAAVEPSATD